MRRSATYHPVRKWTKDVAESLNMSEMISWNVDCQVKMPIALIHIGRLQWFLLVVSWGSRWWDPWETYLSFLLHTLRRSSMNVCSAWWFYGFSPDCCFSLCSLQFLLGSKNPLGQREVNYYRFIETYPDILPCNIFFKKKFLILIWNILSPILCFILFTHSWTKLWIYMVTNILFLYHDLTKRFNGQIVIIS